MRFVLSGLNLRVAVLSLLLVLFTASAFASNEKYGRLDLLTNYPEHTEYLTYKLSYSGLITGFVWKDLADVSFHFQPGEMQFQGMKTCEGIMRLTTENHSFAELFHPVRYEWITLIDPGLSRTYLVEQVDKGRSDNHRIVWLDWNDEKFRFYRKRELKPVEKEEVWDFGGDSEIIYVWDRDGRESVPGFLDRYPPVNDGTLSYLVHDKTEKGLDTESAIDPLSLVYRLRQHDFEVRRYVDLVLTLEDEVDSYRVSYLGKEVININQTPVNALVVQVSRTDEVEAEKEGWVKIWYSDDEARVPLNFQAEAPVGKMRVQITESSLKQALQQENPLPCVVPSGSSNKSAESTH
jgi:hypothetical protein